MKSVQTILEELQMVNPKLYASLETVIRECALASGIIVLTDSSGDTTEHPPDPPNPPA